MGLFFYCIRGEKIEIIPFGSCPEPRKSELSGKPYILNAHFNITIYTYISQVLSYIELS